MSGMEYLGNCASRGEMGRGEALKRGFPVHFVSWGMVARSLDRAEAWAGQGFQGVGVGMLNARAPKTTVRRSLWPAD